MAANSYFEVLGEKATQHLKIGISLGKPYEVRRVMKRRASLRGDSRFSTWKRKILHVGEK